MRLAPNRCSVLIGILACSALVSAAQCPETGVNEALYGTDAWNGYVYDGVNTFDPSSFIGTKNEALTFDENPLSGTTDGGCAFTTETFSVRFKNRQTFSCGLHTFTVGSNYGVRFSIDGGNSYLVNIPSGTVYTTTDVTVFLTGGDYELVLDYYHNTGTSRVSFAYSATPGDYGGEVSGDQTICNDPVDPVAFASLAPARFCSELPASYQWEVNIDGGGYNPITGATSLTYDVPSGLASGSYLYRRRATDGTEIEYSNEISVVADVPLGNESVFGSGSWLAYGYEGADNYASDSYLGYFEEATLNFTEDFSAVAMNGCDLPVEGFTVRFKREETIAACGGYDITVGSEGGGARLYVDGILVIDGYVSVAALTSYSANLFLGVGDHQFILEYYNDTGANSVSFDLTAAPETGGGGVIGADQTACGASYDPVAFTNIEDADYCSGSFTYQWQSSPDGNDPWTDIASATSATYDEAASLTPGTYYYRRAAIDGAEEVYSNVVLVDIKQPAGDEVTYTASAWRGYVYDGANNFNTADYRGYFDIAALNFSTDFSAVVMNGCDFPTDDFSVRFKREATLACGGYDIVLTGDDLVRIYLDDAQLTNGYTTSYTGNVYLDGAAHEFDIEYYDAEGTRNINFSITATGENAGGGVIGYSQDICDATRNPAPFQSLVDAGFCSGPQTYQWQQGSSPSGPFTDIPGANSSSYDPPVLVAGVYYYRREYSDGVNPVYSNVVEVSAFTPIGDEVSFGDNEWIGYVYNNQADWLSDFRGSFTRPTNFDESFCAGVCEFSIDGCPVVASGFSVLFKNRVDFECGSYLVTIGGDDGVRLNVDGVTEIDALTVHSYTTYSKIIYFDGTPDTELELYYFESAGPNRVSFSAVFLGPGDAGTIGGDQYYCQTGVTPTVLTSVEDATSCPSLPAPTYQWQFSLDGVGWNDLTGENSSTYTPADPLVITHYYRRQATVDGYTLNSNIVTVEIDPPQGDQVTYGQNQWIGYAYDTYQEADPWDPGAYQGYMIENTNFDQSFCGSYCTQAINGCDVNMEDFVIRYLNEMTLECGYYRITIGFNDGGRLFIDGTQEVGEYWVHGTYVTLETTEFLTAGTHQFRYEYLEDLDGNRVSFNIEFLGAGTPAVIQGTQVLCSAPYDPATITQVTAPNFECTGDITPEYQWQISTDGTIWSDIPFATSVSYNPPSGHTFTRYYRRKDRDDLGNELFSNTITILYNTDSPPFTGTEFGTAPEWIGHVYDGPDNFSNYQGSFIETMVGNAFDESFCGPDCIFPIDGCDIVTTTFTVQFRTQITLPAGSYTFTIGSDAAARLFLDGLLIIDDYTNHGWQTASNPPIDLTGGTYELILDYYEGSGANRVTFSYTSTPLPVTWYYFNGYYADGKAFVEWRTASEINNSGFEVERSHDGATFTKIGWVEGHGTTNEEQYYLFSDGQPQQGWNYYRLKQIDYDGKFEYSRLIPVYVDDLPDVEIFPNPLRDHVYLSRISTDLPAEITLTNVLGQRSWKLVQDPMQPARFNLPVRLEPGVYSARIRMGDSTFTRKVIIQ